MKDVPILDYIPKGKENRVSTKHLMQVLECSQRELRDIIRALNRTQSPICTTRAKGGGYWRPNTPEELKKAIQSKRRLASDLHNTANLMEKELEKIDGQLELIV